MAKNIAEEGRVVKKSYFLELEGELTILHLEQSSSQKTKCVTSQLVVNCDNGDLSQYTSTVVSLTSEQVQKILSIIDYPNFDFRKKHVI